MNILFHEPVISIGGTTRAMLDYAIGLNIYGSRDYTCYFAYNRTPNPEVEPHWRDPIYKNKIESFENFLKHLFPVIQYTDYNELTEYIHENKIDFVYNIRSGEPDWLVPDIPNAVHAVFRQPAYNKHGIFAYVSEWLAKTSDWPVDFVPHYVGFDGADTEAAKERSKAVRKHLKIPSNARIFGRHGSYSQFNIPFVHEAISEIVNTRDDVYFLLCNTERFITHERVIYVEPLISPEEKLTFILTCDAMLHARERGETFGLAVGEFSVNNKPIITYSESPERAHIDILGDDAFYYHDKDSLKRILLNFKVDEKKDWNKYKQFNLKTVTEKFETVFLNQT